MHFIWRNVDGGCYWLFVRRFVWILTHSERRWKGLISFKTWSGCTGMGSPKWNTFASGYASKQLLTALYHTRFPFTFLFLNRQISIMPVTCHSHPNELSGNRESQGLKNLFCIGLTVINGAILWFDVVWGRFPVSFEDKTEFVEPKLSLLRPTTRWTRLYKSRPCTMIKRNL